MSILNMYPPLVHMPTIPVGNHPGAYGVQRKHHIHEGVDLYCDRGSSVFPIAEGTIRWMGQFTGTDVDSPWWNDTYAVIVEHSFGFMLYGEIFVDKKRKVGETVHYTNRLGYAIPVLKEDKGKPMCMLHVELYSDCPNDLKDWHNVKPSFLIDPTAVLLLACLQTLNEPEKAIKRLICHE